MLSVQILIRPVKKMTNVLLLAGFFQPQRAPFRRLEPQHNPRVQHLHSGDRGHVTWPHGSRPIRLLGRQRSTAGDGRHGRGSVRMEDGHVFEGPEHGERAQKRTGEGIRYETK